MENLSSESILTSIKKMLNIGEDYTHFDTDIIIHINDVFSNLTQIGIGPVGGFFISDSSTTWGEYVSDTLKINHVRIYVYMKVKMIFDPPSSSAAMEAMKESIKEHEWRLNVAAETSVFNGEEGSS